MHNTATRQVEGAKALGRKTIGPKAIVRALEAMARRAGVTANDNAHAAYSAQFSGRPSYEELCEADRMRTVETAYEEWSCDAVVGKRTWGQDVVVADMEKAQGRLKAAFVDGWQRAEGGR
jgi:hypothetical protein